MVMINLAYRRTLQNAGSVLYRGTKDKHTPSGVSILAGGPSCHIQVKSITRTNRVMRDSWAMQRNVIRRIRTWHQYSLVRDNIDGICLNVLRRDIKLVRKTWPPNILANGEFPKAIVFANNFSSQLVYVGQVSGGCNRLYKTVMTEWTQRRKAKPTKKLVKPCSLAHKANANAIWSLCSS